MGVVALTAAFAASAHAQPSVVVHGDAACPSVDMIRTALTAARPDGEWPQQTVTVEVAADRLFLTLGEAPAVRRELPADRDCAVRAQSVALVIAAWSGDLGSRPTDSPVLPAARLAPAPVPTPVLTVARPAPEPRPAPVSTVAKPAPEPTPPPRHVLEADAAAFYSLLWGHGFGAGLDVARTPRDGGLGVRLLGAYQSARDVALEGGTNQVVRLLVGAAATYHLQRRYVFASGDVGLVGTFTRAQGSGYETNGSASVTNLGGVVDVRGGLRRGRARLWLSVRGLRLVHAETVTIQSSSPGVAHSTALSAWDVQLGVGLGFRFE
jgi:hypothetical protein